MTQPGGYSDVNRDGLNRLGSYLRGDFTNPQETKGDNMAAAAPKLAKQQNLDDDWADQVPKKVQDAADEYVGALRSKAKASAKFATAKDSLVTLMRDNGVERVRVQYGEGEKILELEEIEKVKLRKAKKPEQSNGEKE